MSMARVITFTNCQLCVNGQLINSDLAISEDTGTILKHGGHVGGEVVDLDGAILAPGFLELQTNGVNGFHFTHYTDGEQYQEKLRDTARYYITQGVTGFYPTLPTIAPEEFKKVQKQFHKRSCYHGSRLESVPEKDVSTCGLSGMLAPQEFENGASLLGAHAEGPYLSPLKKGAHNESLFIDASTPPTEVYGNINMSTSIKLVTLAAELPKSIALIERFTSYGIRVSLGHSNATFAEGLAAVKAGASCLTHTLNAMAPFQSREPGLAGLISLPDTPEASAPYYSLIPDSLHLHPSTVAVLHRSRPERSILITDSIELAGLPDGVYPGHSQIPFPQRKQGNLATIEGTPTLIGGCISLPECVRNLVAWTDCSLAESVRAVTENVAGFMGIDGEGGRGLLKEGRRADLCILNAQGEVLQTWVAGHKVWEKNMAAE